MCAWLALCFTSFFCFYRNDSATTWLWKSRDFQHNVSMSCIVSGQGWCRCLGNVTQLFHHHRGATLTRVVMKKRGVFVRVSCFQVESNGETEELLTPPPQFNGLLFPRQPHPPPSGGHPPPPLRSSPTGRDPALPPASPRRSPGGNLGGDSPPPPVPTSPLPPERDSPPPPPLPTSPPPPLTVRSPSAGGTKVSSAQRNRLLRNIVLMSKLKGFHIG